MAGGSCPDRFDRPASDDVQRPLVDRARIAPLPRIDRSVCSGRASRAAVLASMSLSMLSSGCAVVAVGSAVVSTAATVASTAVDVGVGAVKVTGKVIGKGVDVVTGGPPPPAAPPAPPKP